MKKLTALAVLLLVGISLSVTAAFAEGACSKKSGDSTKKTATSDGTVPKSG